MVATLSKRKTFPFGASQQFIDRRDEELKRVGDPDEEARQREIIRKMQAEIERLNKVIADLRAERRSTSKSAPEQHKRVPSAPLAVVIDGVEYVDVRWIMHRTGLDHSSVTRQIAKLGIKRRAGMGKILIPKSQAENVKRDPKKRRR